MLRRHSHVRPVVVLVLLWLSALAHPATAQVGTVVLTDGTRYSGVLDRLGSIILVDDDLRLIAFGQRQLSDLIEGADLTAEEEFDIPQIAAARSGILQVVNLHAITRIEPFDEFGRRTVFFLAAPGKEVGLIQAIVKLTPRHARLVGLNYKWEGAIGTLAVPRSVVRSLLHRSIDETRFSDRVRIVNFLARVGWLVAAEEELEAIEKEFPDQAEGIATARRILGELKARRALEEIQRRRNAGQHGLVYRLLQQDLPAESPGEVVVAFRTLRQQYEQDLADLETVRSEAISLLEHIPADLRSRASELAREIRSQATFESLARLRIYLDLRNNPSLEADAKLGLLMSAWLAGTPYARPDLRRALDLWRARRRVRDYILGNDFDREQIERELEETEGLTPELLREVIRYMPPPYAGSPVEPGVITRVQQDVGQGDEAISYYVLLPPEYHPEHRYPAVVSLNGRVTTPKMQAEWWATQAQRYGYIVIAPDYLSSMERGYEFSVAEHLRVVHAIRDALLRFSIDANRVFLSGHYEGAEAAWDIGLGHPDLFAGIIPIAGPAGQFTRFYRSNAQHVPVCIIDGSLNNDSPQENRIMADPLMRAGLDVRFLQYHGRGREPFSDAQLELFDWMERRRRVTWPRKFECRTGRVCDDQFYLVTIRELMPGLINDPQTLSSPGRRSVRTATIRAQVIEDPNTVILDLRGPLVADVWLGPDVVDLARTINLRINGRGVPPQELRPRIGPLLQYYYRTGDRERACFVRWRFERR